MRIHSSRSLAPPASFALVNTAPTKDTLAIDYSVVNDPPTIGRTKNNAK